MTTKQILTVLAGGVVAFLVTLYGVALFQGRASLDPALQTALISLIVTVVGGITVGTQIRQGTTIRENSDKNAKETREKVQEGLDTMNDGLPARIAEGTRTLVKEDTEAAAIRLKAEADAAASRVMLATLAAKLDSLLTVQPPVTPAALPVTPDPLLASIEKNTSDTAAAVSQVAENTAPEVKP